MAKKLGLRDQKFLETITKQELCNLIRPYSKIPDDMYESVIDDVFDSFSSTISFEPNFLKEKSWLDYSASLVNRGVWSAQGIWEFVDARDDHELDEEAPELKWEFSQLFDPDSGDILTDFVALPQDDKRYNWVTIVRHWPNLISDLDGVTIDKKRAQELKNNLLRDFGLRDPIQLNLDMEPPEKLLFALPRHSRVRHLEDLKECVKTNQKAKLQEMQPTNDQLWSLRHLVNDRTTFSFFQSRGLQLENDRLFLAELVERNPSLFAHVLDTYHLPINQSMERRIHYLFAATAPNERQQWQPLFRKIVATHEETEMVIPCLDLQQFRQLMEYIDYKKFPLLIQYLE